MASRRELQRLEDENRTMCQRLTDTEAELTRKEEELKTTNLRKVGVLNDLREYQRRLKETKCQLEKAETAEQQARATAHDVTQALEQCEASIRDQTASSKSTAINMQLEIKSMKCKLAEKTDECDTLQEKLYRTGEVLSSLQGEKSKMSKDDSSRIANLNQALMQAKQNIAQLAEENTTLQARELELEERVQALEHQYQSLLSKTAPPPSSSSSSHRGEASLDLLSWRSGAPTTPTPRRNRHPHCRTPCTPVPEETEFDTLKIEHLKLTKEMQCLETNFQLVSSKSASMRKEKKELEQSLEELQREFDRVLDEKAEMEAKFEETKAALGSKLVTASDGHWREEELAKEAECLQQQLQEIKSLNDKFLSDLKAKSNKLVATEELVRDQKRKNKDLAAEKGRLEGELRSSILHCEELEEDMASHRQLSASHASQQKKKKEAISAYQSKLEKVKEEQQDLLGRLQEANQAMDDEQSRSAILQQANEVMKRQICGLEAAQRELQTERRRKSGLCAEVADLQQQLEALSEENAGLQEECRSLEAACTQSTAQLQRLGRARAEQEEASGEQEEEVRALRRQLEECESELHCATTSLGEKERECSRLVEDIDELQQELANVKNSKQHFESEAVNLVQKVEDLEQQNFQLSTELSDIHNETAHTLAEHNQQQVKIDDLEMKLGDAKSLLLEKESQLSENKYLHELLQSESGDMLSQVTSLSEMVAARNAKIESLQTEVGYYESNTREIMAQIMQLEEDHGQCGRTKRNLQDKIERANGLLGERERQERELERQVGDLRSELNKLRLSSAQLEAAKAELNVKLHLQVENTNSITTSAQQKDIRIQQLEQSVQDREGQLRSVREELEYTRKERDDVQRSLRAEVDSLDRKCQELREKCEESREVELRLQSEVTECCSAMESLQCNNTELEKDRQPLQGRCDQLRSELTLVKDELYLAQKELKSMKSELRYQKRKRSEMEKEMDSLRGSGDEFEWLREEMLKVLDEVPSENTPSSSRRKIRNLLKQSRKRVLKPLHNLID